MKLATYADGSRDGHLVVVSADLDTAHYAAPGGSRLQALLDDWNFLSPQLEDLGATLAGGKARHAVPFDPLLARAPLARAPRCVRWQLAGTRPGMDASADAESSDAPGPAGGAPDARGQAVEEPAWCAGPHLLGEPRSTDWRWHPHLMVVTGDLPWGAEPARAVEAVRLLGWAVRVGLPDAASATGAWHCAPVVATPDAVPRAAAGWTWRLGAMGADGPLRPPRAWSPDAGTVRLPDPAAIGDALAAAARRAPLPAGSLLMLPIDEPTLPGELPAGALGWRLALADPDGSAPFGEVVFAARGTDAD